LYTGTYVVYAVADVAIPVCCIHSCFVALPFEVVFNGPYVLQQLAYTCPKVSMTAYLTLL